MSGPHSQTKIMSIMSCSLFKYSSFQKYTFLFFYKPKLYTNPLTQLTHTYVAEINQHTNTHTHLSEDQHRIDSTYTFLPGSKFYSEKPNFTFTHLPLYDRDICSLLVVFSANLILELRVQIAVILFNLFINDEH